ncbi:hypothetical protein [Lewinella sp. JB7]|uniref:hypothetical protein n=1 Tax=Lewinella sp. JB7 TaxID=2962887 RepID=UPI0020C9C5E8|nr:hypothetical protein [Lewinella sp. JB7]MCP9234991.1 hypothetical protein [Lewinella sp. JB7]
MFRQTIFGLVLVWLTGAPVAGQETEVDYLQGHSVAVEGGRYQDVQGTPYRYPTFRPGVLFDEVLLEYPVDSLNFNGHTSRFEFWSAGELRELIGNRFLRARIADDDGVEHTYAWSINPNHPGKYAELIYHGDYLTATQFHETITDQPLGKKIRNSADPIRFVARTSSYALIDGELKSLNLQPRRLASDLGFRNELTALIKEHGLKPARREDLIRILAHADSLLATQE